MSPIKKIYTAAIFIILFAPSCQQKERLTKEEVAAAIQQFDKGWKEKNPKMVESVLSPSYIYFTQSGGIFDRTNVVHTAGSTDYTLDSVQRKQFDIKIEGNTAVVNTVWIGSDPYLNSPFNDSQRCSITLIKKKGKVEILSEHYTPINQLLKITVLLFVIFNINRQLPDPGSLYHFFRKIIT